MAVLKHITQGNQNPIGLPRVYFCCHPDDVSLYLEPVTRELQEQRACTVYYRSEGEGIPYTHGFLSEMQLFVLPVTSRLLQTENDVLSVELPLALRNRIPVLPLLQENGLTGLFNARCGELQYLSRFDADHSDRTYKQKLEQFFNTVFIKDAQLQRINDAFDATVFLSYRKKDHAHAKEIMRAIHRHELFRDVGIWLDESLVPGEDFNEAIDDAIRKCDCMILTVTPHLLEPGNYILRTEFPLAQQENKVILPIQAAPTDLKKLAEQLPGLPAPISLQEPDALVARLKQALRHRPLRERRNDPGQDYLMGLAYLHGVKTEVDRSRGIALITAAARQNHLPAVDQMIQLCFNDTKKGLDFRSATEWQKKKCHLLYEEYLAHPDADRLNTLSAALIDYSDSFRHLLDFAKSREICRKTIQFLKESPFAATDHKILHRIASCYDRLGSLCMGESDFEQSYCCYKQGLHYHLQLAEISDLPLYTHSLKFNYNNLGNASVMLGNPEQAKDYYRRSLEIKTTGSGEDRRNFAISYEGLGDLCYAEKNWPVAFGYYQKSMEAYRTLVDKRKRPRESRSLSKSYAKLADTAAELRKFPDAHRYYKKSEALLTYLWRTQSSPRDLRKLAELWHRMGDFFLLEGKHPEALFHYEKSLESYRQLEQAASPYPTEQAQDQLHRKLAENYALMAQKYKTLIDE